MNEDSHDKVWGVIKLSGTDWVGNYVSFWGRRGKKLQTKIYTDSAEYQMENLFNKKLHKGYQVVNTDKLNDVYPNFEADLKKMSFWAQFKVT